MAGILSGERRGVQNMRAIRVRETGGPGVMKIEDVPEPSPRGGEVLVRIRAAGVNPVDTYLRGGTQGYRPDLPYTPGVDGAGIVVAVGDGVHRLAVGARVYVTGTVSGTYAEMSLCDQGRVWTLPERVSFAQGAGLGVPYGAAYRALFQRGRARAGETVLVHGATGGVGLAAVQLARAAGLRVLGSADDREGRALATREGAHHVLEHGKPGHLDEVLEVTGGRGVDLILEMLANVNLGEDPSVLAPGGRIVVIGSRGRTEVDPRGLMAGEREILGMMLAAATEGELTEIHAAVGAGLESGALNPVVAEEFPLAEAAEAHRLVEGWGGRGKVVLRP